MTLEYESTLADVSEPQIRHYLRSRTYARRRVWESISAGLMAGLMVFAISYFTGDRFHWSLPLLAFIVAFFAIFSTYKDTVSKRITKYLQREIGHRLPAPMTYSVEDQQIRCKGLGSEILFDLERLCDIVEDSQRLELGFGDAGLCTIPLRAFTDDTHKAAFLTEIRREQGGGGNSAALRASPLTFDRRMKRQLVFVAGLSLIFGVSIGYFVSLGSSFKKSADAMPALASALSKTDDFSDLDMAVIVRMFGLSETGKSAHTDRAAIWRLAKYYNQRSNLTTEEQEALGFSVISPKILKLQESNSSLRDAIAAGQSGGSKSNTQKSNKAVEATR